MVVVFYKVNKIFFVNCLLCMFFDFIFRSSGNIEGIFFLVISKYVRDCSMRFFIGIFGVCFCLDFFLLMFYGFCG